MNLLEIELPFGRIKLPVKIPKPNLIGVFLPGESGPGLRDVSDVREAMAHPFGTPLLRDLAKPRHKVAIIISDQTRLCPTAELLPAVMDELKRGGVSVHNVTIVAALGLHRPMTPAELQASVGETVFRQVRVVNHDPSDTVRVGITSRGTPVELFRPLVEADLRVCLGSVDPHYFAGYTGGAKAILPGCASEATITANHSMMTCPTATAGRLNDNPVRADIEEGAGIIGIHFILNTVMGPDGHVRGVVAGDMITAHRRACEIVEQHSFVAIPERGDIVVVSAGGYPKDVNLYQSQKALDNASYAVRDGGIIVLVAECIEGFGNETFKRWLMEAKSPDEILKRIEKKFVLGGHKAAAVASVLKRAKVYLVSSLPDSEVANCHMEPFSNLDMALQAAFDELGRESRVIVLPYGSSTLPKVSRNADLNL